ncbi:hypothetical protein ACWGNE_09285 [Streptomyces xiamenensis]
MTHDDGVRVDIDDYELRWPKELFASEGRRLLRSSGRTRIESWELLLEEALGSSAVADFQDLAHHADPWGPYPNLNRDAWLTELVNRAQDLREAHQPAPYWPQRIGRPHAHAPSADPVKSSQMAFARLINEFDDRGYLTEVFGQLCVDSDVELPERSQILLDRLGLPDLWPLQPDTWTLDVFYGLIEVFHDLVSRPRSRHRHDFSGCGWHRSEFHAGAARTLYRWKVNRILRGSGADYELAAEGQDTGRLVAVTDDARNDLVHRSLNTTEPSHRERVAHALSLFRGRAATAEDKRSAIVALAGILESQRPLLKTHLDRHDEDALFNIANNYDLRHRNARQRVDYDDAFLDWIFWWYLATIELVNQLLNTRSASQQPPVPQDPW